MQIKMGVTRLLGRQWTVVARGFLATEFIDQNPDAWGVRILVYQDGLVSVSGGEFFAEEVLDLFRKEARKL